MALKDRLLQKRFDPNDLENPYDVPYLNMTPTSPQDLAAINQTVEPEKEALIARKDAVQNLAAVTPGEQAIPSDHQLEEGQPFIGPENQPNNYAASPVFGPQNKPEGWTPTTGLEEAKKSFLEAQPPGLEKGLNYGSILSDIEKLPEYQAQKQMLENQKTFLKGNLARPVQTDLSPIASMIDALHGTNLYQTTRKPEDRTALIEKLQSEIQKGQANLTDEQRKYLHDILGVQNARGQASLGRLVIQANKHITDDAMIKSLEQAQVSADRGIQVLQDPKATWKQYNSAMQDYEKALAGTGQYSEGKLARTEIESVKGNLNNLLVKYGIVNPNSDEQIPIEFRKHLLAAFSHLMDLNDKHMETRAIEKSKGIDLGNEAANNALQTAVKQYAYTGRYRNLNYVPPASVAAGNTTKTNKTKTAGVNPIDAEANRRAALKANE